MTAPLAGEGRPAGDLTCARLTEDGHCGRQSTLHVLWTSDGDNGVMCDEHWAETRRRWAFYDSHPIAAFCTMPDSRWVFSQGEKPGECVIPVDEETTNAVLEAQFQLEAEPTHRLVEHA